MHATLVVLIDREREEQKNNDITTGKDLTASNTNYMINNESNTFIKAYNVCETNEKEFFVEEWIFFVYLDGV